MPAKGKAFTVRLTDEEEARWSELKRRDGGAKAAFLRAMAASEGANDIDLPAALERAAAELRARDQANKASPAATIFTAPDPLTKADLERLSAAATSPPAPIADPVTDGRTRAASRFGGRKRPE